MNTDSNKFTFGFSIVMVLVVAISLSWVSMVLKPYQKKNKERAKKQSILSTIGVFPSSEEVDMIFSKYITSQLVLNDEGEEKSGDAFSVDLALELRKEPSLQDFPLYIAEKDGRTYYIVPLRGFGLWDAIWGYIAINDDLHTVYGANFDHKSETPGLGAEISTSAFSDQFRGKKIKNAEGKFLSIKVVKGGTATLPTEQQDYAVDAISGGTITSDGVSSMINERLRKYLPYFNYLKQ